MHLINIIFISLLLLSCSSIQKQKNIQRHPQSIHRCLKILHKFLINEKLKRPKLTETNGIEVELLTPENLNQESSAALVLEYIRLNYDNFATITKDDGSVINSFDYKISYEVDGLPKIISIPHEPSLYNPVTKESIGIEITSNILNTEKDYKQFYDLINLLKRKGLENARGVGGTHIHVGTNNLSVKDLRNIFESLLNAQAEILKRFSPDKDRKFSSYATLVPGLNSLERLDQDLLLKDIELRHTFFTQGAVRYNTKYDTIEFRLFNSTNSSTELESYIDFSNNFTRRVLEEESFKDRLKNMSFDDILNEIEMDH